MKIDDECVCGHIRLAHSLTKKQCFGCIDCTGFISKDDDEFRQDTNALINGSWGFKDDDSKT